MDIKGIHAHADGIPHLLRNGGVDQPLTVVAAHRHLEVHALEDDVLDHAVELSLIGLDHLDILGTDDDVDGLVLLKALVNAVQLHAEEPHLAVLEHDAVDDIRLADEVGDKGVGGFVIDIFGRTDLSDHAVVHDTDAIGHRQRFFLVMGNIYKGFPGFLLKLL